MVCGRYFINMIYSIKNSKEETIMKKLGIIGGLGSLATAYFMQLIVEMTDAKLDQEHIEVFVHSRPQIPDRTSYILDKSRENPMPQLVNTGKGLIQQGAQILAIPCITAHYFQKQLEQELDCTIINAIEETAIYLRSENISKVGIMATEGTIKSGLFQNKFSEYGIECMVTDEVEQAKVTHIIYNDVKAGLPIEMELVTQVSAKLFTQGAQVILLGCTELSIIKRDCVIGEKFLDVMEVLARQSVLLCGELKSEYRNLITK